MITFTLSRLTKALFLLLMVLSTSAFASDLELSMTSDNPNVGIYDYITITATLNNNGTQSAENVVVEFDIPTNAAIAGEFPTTVSQGTINGFYGGSSTGTWTLGSLAPNTSQTLTITFFTLSESDIFYGQVTQSSTADGDSTPGNGTCCTTNEDDEAAYTFPNDEPSCTYQQAFAELICNDNGTPANTNDDSYTLSFRADGTSGEFNLFIPELGYNQTSFYTIGFTELTQLSLDIESLELIFSDAAGTADCGETITVAAPNCGLQTDCGFGNVCADLELTAANTPTPGIYADATAQFTLENDFLGENATGIQVTFTKNDLNIVGTPTVSQGTIELYWTDNPVWNVGELAPNQTATIDFELYTLGEEYSLFGEVTAQDQADFDSTPNNGNGVNPQEDDEAIYAAGGVGLLFPDLTITGLTVDSPIYNPNELFTFDFSLNNIGTVATDILSNVGFWVSEDNVLSADDIAVGTLDVQAVIDAGETLSYGNFIDGNIVNNLSDGQYFLILNADRNDIIAESNETNNDAAVGFTIGNSCDLVITDTDLRCANETNDSPFVYSIEVAGASGNTVDYQVLGTNFSGTIIVGQLVDIATLPQGTDFTVVISEPNNSACDYTLTSNIPVAPGVCFGGSNTPDVMLSVSNNQNTPIGIYEAGEALFTLTNTSTEAATGLVVTFSKNQVNVTGTPTTTAGTAQFHWTNNPIWNVGTLEPGQSEIIIFPVFTVGENFSLYGEVTAMNETDSDSTPDNGNGITPQEDDESLWPSGSVGGGLPDLAPLEGGVFLSGTAPGSVIDFSLTYKNFGTVAVEDDYVVSGIFTDSDINGSYLLQGTQLVTATLNADETTTITGSFILQDNVPDGLYYFGLIVDAGGNIVESNEENNQIIYGPFIFENGGLCTIDIELLDVSCSETEGFYDFTIDLISQNPGLAMLFYTVLNDQFLGAETGTSGIYTFTDIPVSQGASELLIYNASGGDCEDMITVDPPLDCGLISVDGVDLELTVSTPAAIVSLYDSYSVTYTLTNAGNETATDVRISSPRIDNVVFEGGNEFTASQGDFNFSGVNFSVWDVGTLATGETASLTMNLFTIEVGNNVPNYASVTFLNETDIDSSPNIGECCTAIEDDEAGVFVDISSNFTSDDEAEIQSAAALSVNAYPVPVQDYLSVEIYSTNSEVANLAILDITGRAQIFQEADDTKGKQTVDVPVSDLERGVYLLSVRKGEETVVQRFVKM